MGCCVSRDSKHSLTNSGPDTSEILNQAPLLLSNRRFLESEISIQDSGEEVYKSTGNQPDLNDIYTQTDDPKIISILSYAEDLINNSKDWRTEYTDSTLHISTVESTFSDIKSDAVLQEVSLGAIYPLSSVLEAIIAPIIRMSWDKNVTNMIIKEPSSPHDMICYTRLEYLYILKKYVIERRVIRKYKEGFVIVFYTLDDEEVPSSITTNATVNKVMAGVTYIYSFENITKLRIFIHSEPQPRVIKPVVLTCMKSWVYCLKKYLERCSDNSTSH
jgi:hypothetical protein